MNIDKIKIMSELIDSLLNIDDENILKENIEKIYFLITNLVDQIENFEINIQNFSILKGNDKETWILNNIKNFLLILVEFIKLDKLPDFEWGNFVVKIISFVYIINKKKNYKDEYKSLIKNVFLCNIITYRLKKNSFYDYLISELELENFECFYLILNVLYKLLKDNKNILECKSLYRFLGEIVINFEDDNQKYFYIEEINTKNIYNKIVNLLISNSNKQSKLFLLKNINKFFKNMENPGLISDFILKIYNDESSSSEELILSLNLLIILIAKYSFNYNYLYIDLYKILQNELKNKYNPSIFSCKYSNKFFKILEICLRSNKVSKTYLSSFIKILLKLIFKINSTETIRISFLIFNLVKKNLFLKNLFISSFEDKSDEFLIDNSLELNENLNFKSWEINSLKNHYLKEVRLIFKNFIKNIDKMDYINLDDYKNLNIINLIKKRENFINK